MRLLTYGGFTSDYLELADGRAFLGVLGGNAVYSAIGAHLWGISTVLVGRVGSDYPQQWLLRMADAGIDVTAVERIAHPHIQVFPARYDSQGHREIIIPSAAFQECNEAVLGMLSRYLRSEENVEAIRPFMMAPSDIPKDCYRVAAFHCAPVPLTYQTQLVAAFKKAGALVSVDPHVLEMQSLDNANTSADLLQHVDFFLPSREEILALNPNADLVAQARKFAAMGPAVVVIKLGTQGSLVYDRERDNLHRVPPYPTRAVDPTGAGDAYCGGFLAGFLQTSDPLSAALWGTVSASFVIEAPGALYGLEIPLSKVRERLRQLERSIQR